jgi:hypothetical protein
MRRILPPLLLFLVLVLAGCGASGPCATTRLIEPQSPTTVVQTEIVTTATPGTWSDVMQWTDSVYQQTVLFTVPAEWRIAWSATAATPSASALALLVYIYNNNGQKIDMAIDTDHASSGTYYAHAMPGSFYLNIQTREAAYAIEVQVTS